MKHFELLFRDIIEDLKKDYVHASVEEYSEEPHTFVTSGNVYLARSEKYSVEFSAMTTEDGSDLSLTHFWSMEIRLNCARSWRLSFGDVENDLIYELMDVITGRHGRQLGTAYKHIQQESEYEY